MKKSLHVFFAAVFAAVAAFADAPTAEWVMWNSDGIVKNGANEGERGNLTLSEGVEFSDDVHVGNTGGTALRISGEDPTAAAETEASFDPLAGAEKFTIMAWVRRESEDPGDNTNACIFSDFAYIDGHPCGVEFRFNRAQGNLYLRVNGEGGSLYAAGIPADNWTWRHVAVSCDMTIESPSANTHFYIDGIQVGAGMRLAQPLEGPAANNVPVTIGNFSANRSAENQLVGSIDDVFVFADWAPEPSGNGNLNPEIRDWMLLDDADRIPEVEPEPEEEWEVPPVKVGDVIAQKLGEERNYEELAEGLIFVNAETGDLWYVNEENPHGRAICVCKPFPNWHRFQDTVWFLGHVLQLNNHYSMQAEAHTLSIRYGGEAVWRILGDEGGDLAGMLTVEVEDESHLLIQANASGTNVVLQVCTNLMEVTPWKPAENATIYTQTDAATTWRVTLLDFEGKSGLELYRVLNGNNPRPAGVYCERPLRANRGIVVPDGQAISLGGVERYEWPDTSEIASNRLAIGAVATNLATHAGRTDNPHGVTAAQIGALTAETDATALAALGTHTGNTANPHGVTAAQAGALPAAVDEDAEDEAYVVEHPTRFSWPVAAPAVEMAEDDDGEYEVPRIGSPFTAVTNNGLAVYYSQNRSYGYGLVLNTPLSFLRMSMGERARLVFSREVPHGPEKAHLEADEVTIKAGVYDEEEEEWVPGQIMLDGNTYVAGNTTLDGNVQVEGNMTVTDDLTVGDSLTAKSLTVGTGTTTNLSELATAASVSAVTGRVSAIEADYVTSADIGDFATTQAVASVERRVGDIEDATGEYWVCWDNTNLVDGVTNYIPTDWPARKVRICLAITKEGSYTLAMPDYAPDAPRELRVYNSKVGNANSSLRFVSPDGTAIAASSASSVSRREVDYFYTPGTGWISVATAISGLSMPSGTLPADTTFLPTTNNPVATQE